MSIWPDGVFGRRILFGFVGGGKGGRHVYTITTTRKEKKEKEKKTVRTFRNRVPIIG